MSISNPDLFAACECALKIVDQDDREFNLLEIVRSASERHPSDARQVALLVADPVTKFWAFLDLYEHHGDDSDHRLAEQAIRLIQIIPKDDESPDPADLAHFLQAIRALHQRDFEGARELLLTVEDPILISVLLKSIYRKTRDPLDLEALGDLVEIGVSEDAPFLVSEAQEFMFEQASTGVDKQSSRMKKCRDRLLDYIEQDFPEMVIKREFGALLETGDIAACRFIAREFPGYGLSTDAPEYVSQLAEGYARSGNISEALRRAASLSDFSGAVRVHLAIYKAHK